MSVLRSSFRSGLRARFPGRLRMGLNAGQAAGLLGPSIPPFTPGSMARLAVSLIARLPPRFVAALGAGWRSGRASA